jgi:hypothetical protein
LALGSACLLVGCAPKSADQVQAPPPRTDVKAEPSKAEPSKPAPEVKQPLACKLADQAEVEARIDELEDLARADAPRAKLDAFIADHKCIVTAKTHPYGSALMTALEFEREEMALALLAAGSAVPDHALGLAARGGLDRFIKVLLERGVSPDAGNSWGYTPLHHAAKYGKASTIELLLASGAKPSVNASNDGFTPLHLAVIDRRLEAVELLIAAQADLAAVDDDGRTPLHWGPFAYAPQPKHIYAKLGEPHDTVWVDPGPAVVIEMLLDAGADIEARDLNGDTPLYEAANIGSVRGVEKLLERGAKANVKNKKGRSPMDEAKRRGDDDIIKMLKAAR